MRGVRPMPSRKERANALGGHDGVWDQAPRKKGDVVEKYHLLSHGLGYRGDRGRP